MVKHRPHVPLILVLSLSLGLIPDLFHALTYGSILTLWPVIFIGCVIGSVVAYGCVCWVRRHQVRGTVNLSVAATFLVLLYVMITYVIPWTTVLKDINAICFVFLSKDLIDCGYKSYVMQSTADFILWLGFYVWGIRFERRFECKLTYRLPLSRPGGQV